MEKLRCFPLIKVAYQDNRLPLSQRKYMVGSLARDRHKCKHINTLMEADMDFWNEDCNVYDDIK